MNHLFVLHDPPQGTERTCNDIRFPGDGAGYVELGGGPAAKGEGNFPTPSAPQVNLCEPSAAHHAEKEQQPTRWNVRS
ncbi:hypothetical protein ACQP1O_23680 [Nocardia sp. CA-151230]|uniref:hypothetical protein n=1 Tax=Nocardia sp. CA-151230 TaxID=3239982 RepID=UPI003D8E79C4